MDSLCARVSHVFQNYDVECNKDQKFFLRSFKDCLRGLVINDAKPTFLVYAVICSLLYGDRLRLFCELIVNSSTSSAVIPEGTTRNVFLVQQLTNSLSPTEYPFRLSESGSELIITAAIHPATVARNIKCLSGNGNASLPLENIKEGDLKDMIIIQLMEISKMISHRLKLFESLPYPTEELPPYNYTPKLGSAHELENSMPAFVFLHGLGIKKEGGTSTSWLQHGTKMMSTYCDFIRPDDDRDGEMEGSAPKGGDSEDRDKNEDDGGISFEVLPSGLVKYSVDRDKRKYQTEGGQEGHRKKQGTAEAFSFLGFKKTMEQKHQINLGETKKVYEMEELIQHNALPKCLLFMRENKKKGRGNGKSHLVHTERQLALSTLSWIAKDTEHLKRLGYSMAPVSDEAKKRVDQNAPTFMKTTKLLYTCNWAKKPENNLCPVKDIEDYDTKTCGGCDAPAIYLVKKLSGHQ